MGDSKLTYWYDWEIFGPDGSGIVNLRNLLPKLPKLDKEKFSDIDYLCKCIRERPEATCMNPEFGYQISILRQKAFKLCHTQRVAIFSMENV